MAPPAATARRPLRSRSNRAIRGTAAALARFAVSPNAISVAGVGFAAAAGAALVAVPYAAGATQAALLGAAAAGIQLRLFANVLDGLVAVEGGRGTANGVLYNEVPDRIADAIILVAAGYALSPAFGPGLGWLAALLAVGTAYVRQVGGALGCAQDFVGPLAKQQRMALLTAGVLSSAFEALAWGYEGRALAATLALISGGAAVTIARRLRRISTEIAR